MKERFDESELKTAQKFVPFELNLDDRLKQTADLLRIDLERSIDNKIEEAISRSTVWEKRAKNRRDKKRNC